MKIVYTYKKGCLNINGLKVSQGNRKLDAMFNIALDTSTCPKNAPCHGTCYFECESKIYKNIQDNALNNRLLWENDPDTFFQSLEKVCKLAITKHMGVRMFEGGDIPNYDFFVCLMDLAKKYPGLMHSMTKQYLIVNRYIEEHGNDKSCILKYYNLRFSQWENYPMFNNYDMPVFALTFEEKETTCPEQRLKMQGIEWSCKDCFDHKAGCYSVSHKSIKCIDHKTEQKIIRNRKLWKK